MSGFPPAACAILGDLDEVPRPARNHLWMHFMDPARRERFPDWPRSSRLVVAKFRADHAHHLGDPSFEELLGTLRKSSPEFCKLWKKHEVAQTGVGRKRVQHPVVGTML